MGCSQWLQPFFEHLSIPCYQQTNVNQMEGQNMAPKYNLSFRTISIEKFVTFCPPLAIEGVVPEANYRRESRSYRQWRH
jgi:hypothetical protein